MLMMRYNNSNKGVAVNLSNHLFPLSEVVVVIIRSEVFDYTFQA